MSQPFQQPNFVHAQDFSNITRGIDNLFNAYTQGKLQAQQLALGQQNLTIGQNNLNRQNATDIAQYGAPIGQMTTDQLSQASQGLTYPGQPQTGVQSLYLPQGQPQQGQPMPQGGPQQPMGLGQPQAGPMQQPNGPQPQGLHPEWVSGFHNFLQNARNSQAFAAQEAQTKAGIEARTLYNMGGAPGLGQVAGEPPTPKTVKIDNVDYIETFKPNGERDLKEIPNRAASTEGDLRKEAAEQGKGFEDLKSSYGKLLYSAKDALSNPKSATGPDDSSMLFAFIRMQHPNALVREGQIQNVENATGLTSKALNLWEKTTKGTPLNPSQRQEFVQAAAKLYNSAKPFQDQSNAKFSDIAKRNNANPANLGLTSDLPSEVKKLHESLSSSNQRISVIAPDGTRGTFPAGKALPEGYRKAN